MTTRASETMGRDRETGFAGMKQHSMLRHLSVGAMCLGGLLLAAGCASKEKTDDGAMESSPETQDMHAGTTSESGAPKLDLRVAAADKRFVVGPTDSVAMGYRIDWQFETGHNVASVTTSNRSVYVLETGNFLTRIDMQDGDRFWRVPVGQPSDEILSVSPVENDRQVVCLSTTEAFVVETPTGLMVDRHSLGQVAATGASIVDTTLVYGSQNGQIIWHAYPIQSKLQAYEVGPTMDVAPLVVNGYTAAISKDGRVMVTGARRAHQFWNRKLLDTVTCSPSSNGRALYVAGIDQHLRAFDLADGARLWTVLTTAPLVDSPVVLGDFVYQQIDGAGLACYEAEPQDMPGGVHVWTCDDVTGSVITTRRNELLTWDADRRVMSIISRERGLPIAEISLPKIAGMYCSSLVDGDLVVWDDEGNVSRLVPRN